MDHLHHDHGHDHHHGHEHGHSHGLGDYYLEQLLTIFVCGAFGVVAILMNRFAMLEEPEVLRILLHECFRLPRVRKLSAQTMARMVTSSGWASALAQTLPSLAHLEVDCLPVPKGD